MDYKNLLIIDAGAGVAIFLPGRPQPSHLSFPQHLLLSQGVPAENRPQEHPHVCIYPTGLGHQHRQDLRPAVSRQRGLAGAQHEGRPHLPVQANEQAR
jgi:hypothetical protein